jgi:hypothetical protein
MDENPIRFLLLIADPSRSPEFDDVDAWNEYTVMGQGPRHDAYVKVVALELQHRIEENFSDKRRLRITNPSTGKHVFTQISSVDIYERLMYVFFDDNKDSIEIDLEDIQHNESVEAIKSQRGREVTWFDFWTAITHPGMNTLVLGLDSKGSSVHRAMASQLGSRDPLRLIAAFDQYKQSYTDIERYKRRQAAKQRRPQAYLESSSSKARLDEDEQKDAEDDDVLDE